MKLFWTRMVNVLLIGAVLVVYQQHAQARAQQVADYEEQKKQLLGQAEQSVGGYQDGTYTGTATGFSGDLTVDVTVEGGEITKVEIADTADDAEYIDKASALLDEIVEQQGVDGVDVVTGATFSSNGILDAFRDAMEE